MALYQSDGREPLLDTHTQAALQRRARELVGLLLVAFGVVFGLILGTYTPEDPSWISVTEAPIGNVFGRIGAAIAAPLMIVVGIAAWVIPLAALTWGMRFILHSGAERAPSRAVFVPLALALASVYAATLLSDASQGRGGLFGDTVLAALIQILPVGTVLGLKLFSFVTFFGAGTLVLFAIGVTRREIGATSRFMWVGLVSIYALLWHAIGRGAQRAPRQRTDTRSPAFEAGPAPLANHEAPTQRVVRPDTGGMFSLSKLPDELRATAPEFTETTAPDYAPQAATAPPPETARLRSKIASVISLRSRPAQAQEMPEPEGPPMTAAQRAVAKYKKGPDPMLLDQGLDRTAPAQMPHMQDYVNEVIDPYDTPTYGEQPMPQYAPAAPAKRVVQHPPRRATPVSRQAKEEAQPTLKFDPKEAQYETPPLALLETVTQIQRAALSDEALEENARMLESVLDDYGVKGEIVSVRPGPVVTMYELEPAPGLKASRVVGLADDIARSMSALSARVSTVPGRSVIGIELPNENRETVGFREILSTREYGDGSQSLPLALGKDIGGDPVVANLAKMPHLLIAGTTGSGKSVAINTMILSLLYKLTPEECRLIMIDPKMLELSVYDGIPHLLSPVVTDPKKAVVALKWVVSEMEERYRKMSKMGVRNIDGYNSRVVDALSKGELFSRTVQTGFDDDTGEPVFETEEFAPEKLPYIVVIVDEMADLMMVAGKEIEACIQRLAQMARASGIHLIMATQRPSVDVITGTIKANFPTRISFQVTSKIDSRTILGEQGAEQLLGMGDMLYMAGGGRIQRCHAPFISDQEVEKIVSYLKAYGPPEYVGGVAEGPDGDKEADIDAVLGLGTGGNTGGEDALYDQAVAIVLKDRKCSTSYIQRKLSIGYNKAARLVEQMEDQSVVSAANHVGKREILVPEH